MKSILAASLAVALIAPVAANAASFSFFGDMYIEVDPSAVSGPVDDLDISIYTDSDDDNSTIGNATAASAAFAFDAGFSAVANANGEGSASGAPFGAANAEGFALFGLELFNLSSSESITIPFSFFYDFSAETLGSAFGESFLSFSAFICVNPDSPDCNGVTPIWSLSESLASLTGNQSLSLSDMIAFDLTLAPFDFAFVTMFVEFEGGATSVAPIPLPAGLPLMLAGLGALALVRRRAAA